MEVEDNFTCENKEESEHAAAMLIDDKESVSDSDSCKFGVNLNQGTTIDTPPVKDSDVNLDILCIANLNIFDTPLTTNVENSTDVKYGINTDVKIPIVVCPIPIDALVENSVENNNDISDQSVVQDKVLNADNPTEGNPEDQVCISQDENTENKINSVPKRPLSPGMKTHSSSSIKVITYTGLRCKTSLVFIMCCVIGCCLIPFTVYYVSQAGDSDITDPEYSHEKNISSTKIRLMRWCNFSASSDSDCMDQILYTYEALRTINLPSSQQYCSERVETLFCDALMECSNESYVKDIVCQQVRQEYCTAEWRMLEVHNQTDGLIDCEEYGETAPLNCSDQFDLANDGSVCLPLCGEFSQYSEAYTTPRIVLFAVSLFMNIIGGILIIAISIRKRKKMCHFPQILVILNAGNIAIVDLLLFISTITVGRWNMLCSRKFLYDALDNPATFCIIQGFLILSGTNLYSLFWLLYISHLALKIFYPLKSIQVFNSDHSREVFIAEILIAFFIATAPSIVSIGLSNIGIVTFPPIQCGNSNRTYCFYTAVLPVMIVTCISGSLMILALYKLHMHYAIFKRRHQESVSKLNCTCKFTTSEAKIAFVLFYWVAHAVMVFTAISRRAGRDDTFDYYLRSYVDCMAGGNRRDHDCQEIKSQLEAETNSMVEVTNMMFNAFLNFASLPFVIQFKTIKNVVSKLRRPTAT